MPELSDQTYAYGGFLEKKAGRWGFWKNSKSY